MQVHFPGSNQAQVPGRSGEVRSHLPSTPEVPGIQLVSPGCGLDIRQSMGWTKVCGTAQSGIWVLNGNARTCMFPANLDNLRVEWMKRCAYKTAWVTPGHDCLCSYLYGHGAAVRPQTDIAIWMGLLVYGAGSHPSYHLDVVRRMCQRCEREPVRWSRIIYSLAQR